MTLASHGRGRSCSLGARRTDGAGGLANGSPACAFRLALNVAAIVTVAIALLQAGSANWQPNHRQPRAVVAHICARVRALSGSRWPLRPPATGPPQHHHRDSTRCRTSLTSLWTRHRHAHRRSLLVGGGGCVFALNGSSRCRDGGDAAARCRDRSGHGRRPLTTCAAPDEIVSIVQEGLAPLGGQGLRARGIRGSARRQERKARGRAYARRGPPRSGRWSQLTAVGTAAVLCSGREKYWRSHDCGGLASS